MSLKQAYCLNALSGCCWPLLQAAPRASAVAGFSADEQQIGSAAAGASSAVSVDLRPGQVSSGAGPALLNTSGITVADLGVKNVHALRILFNCAFRLADSLGPSWVLIVEVLCTLDRVLPAAGAGTGAKVRRRAAARLQR